MGRILWTEFGIKNLNLSSGILTCVSACKFANDRAECLLSLQPVESQEIALKQVNVSILHNTIHSSPCMMRKCQDSAPSCWAHVSILKLHLHFKSSLRFLRSPGTYDILELWKAANADVTDLICSLSPSAQQTQSLRCSATWAAKDKALFFFFFFGQPSQSFLGLPGLAAGVQMCGNWVWNGLFEVELPLCSSVIAILPIFSL